MTIFEELDWNLQLLWGVSFSGRIQSFVPGQASKCWSHDHPYHYQTNHFRMLTNFWDKIATSNGRHDNSSEFFSVSSIPVSVKKVNNIDAVTKVQTSDLTISRLRRILGHQKCSKFLQVWLGLGISFVGVIAVLNIIATTLLAMSKEKTRKWIPMKNPIISGRKETTITANNFMCLAIYCHKVRTLGRSDYLMIN